MKKSAVLLAISMAFASFGFIACDGDDDSNANSRKNAIHANNNSGNENNSCSVDYPCADDPCADYECAAIRSPGYTVQAVLDGDACACDYSCADGYKKVDNASDPLGFACVEITDCESDPASCGERPCVCAIPGEGYASHSIVDGDSCSCEYSCLDGYRKVDDDTAGPGFICEKIGGSCGDDPALPCIDDPCENYECLDIRSPGYTVQAVADGDACACEYSCADGYKKVDNASDPLGFACVAISDCESDPSLCEEKPCVCAIPGEGYASHPIVDGDSCSCEYSCLDGYRKVDDASAGPGFICEKIGGSCGDDPALPCIDIACDLNCDAIVGGRAHACFVVDGVASCKPTCLGDSDGENAPACFLNSSVPDANYHAIVEICALDDNGKLYSDSIKSDIECVVGCNGGYCDIDL